MPKPDLHAIARVAMNQYGFAPFFTKEALQQAEMFKPAGGPQPGVRDLRGSLWSSIDNADSLDLDQLEYCEPAAGNAIRVLVAIADVESAVPRSSAIDLHAARNATSVYTGIEIFPMLPQRLSADMTSLLPGTDHAAVVTEFTVGADGVLSGQAVYRALVRNQAKLVYEEAGDWLEGKETVVPALEQIAGLKEQIRLQYEAALRLRRVRVEAGTLEFETIEPKAIVRKEEIVGLVVQHKNAARVLIENLMIAANQVMAGFLEKSGFPVIQRIVRTPKNWEGICAVAAGYGEVLPPLPDARALAVFLQKRKEADPLHFADLSLSVVKLLGPGEYALLDPGKVSIGHFGLAVMDYTHSTAPNRRYVDVLIQRLVKSALSGSACPYTSQELVDLALRCTDRDQAAKKVERFMRKAEAAVLLSGRIGETFEAIVTGVSPKGSYVRLLELPAEGRVTKGDEGLVVGQQTKVRLTGMDPYKGFIDFAHEEA